LEFLIKNGILHVWSIPIRSMNQSL
jgi:hypothetical protein